ncbi:MAG: STAS domain-containing protein [Rubrivivax sp.]|nr:STAS domain-containing protein [Rubrivivax sp.]
MDMEVMDAETGATDVRLVGRLDAAGADRIGLRFTVAVASKPQPALVDLAGVSFVASMGIRLLVATAKALRLKGHTMVLYGAQTEVQDTFEQAALDQILDIAADRPQALQRIAG